MAKSKAKTEEQAEAPKMMDRDLSESAYKLVGAMRTMNDRQAANAVLNWARDHKSHL